MTRKSYKPDELEALLTEFLMSVSVNGKNVVKFIEECSACMRHLSYTATRLNLEALNKSESEVKADEKAQALVDLLHYYNHYVEEGYKKAKREIENNKDQ